jgi:hypothetical protein
LKIKSNEWCVGAHFEQYLPYGSQLGLIYAFKPGYSPQDLSQVIEANKPLAVITCGESSSDEVTPPILFSQDKGDELMMHNSP